MLSRKCLCVVSVSSTCWPCYIAESCYRSHCRILLQVLTGTPSDVCVLVTLLLYALPSTERQKLSPPLEDSASYPNLNGIPHITAMTGLGWHGCSQHFGHGITCHPGGHSTSSKRHRKCTQVGQSDTYPLSRPQLHTSTLALVLLCRHFPSVHYCTLTAASLQMGAQYRPLFVIRHVWGFGGARFLKICFLER